MTIQTKTQFQSEIQFFMLPFDQFIPGTDAWQISAGDLGYEIEDTELADALLEPFLPSFSNPDPAELDPDDFESIYQVFLS